jgi:hypothetical protein
VFPNPFNEELKIQFNFENGREEGMIQVIEVGSGRVLQEKMFDKLSGEELVNTKNLGNGMYIVKVQQTGNKAIYFKVISSKE